MAVIVYKNSLFDNHWFYYYYVGNKTNVLIWHGLVNECYGVGYRYHDKHKGFWLKYKNWL